MIKQKDQEILKDTLSLGKDVETFFEKTVTKFGNSAKIDTPKTYIGKRVYVIIMKR